MGKKIALASASSSCAAIVTSPQTLEEKIEALTTQVDNITAAFHLINSAHIEDERQSEVFDDLLTGDISRDGIPIGISLVGQSVRGGIHVLTVGTDGYYIGIIKYDSLSAAAEAASGVRRSGWTYWKMPGGQTVKEAFGRR